MLKCLLGPCQVSLTGLTEGYGHLRFIHILMVINDYPKTMHFFPLTKQKPPKLFSKEDQQHFSRLKVPIVKALSMDQSVEEECNFSHQHETLGIRKKDALYLKMTYISTILIYLSIILLSSWENCGIIQMRLQPLPKEETFQMIKSATEMLFKKETEKTFISNS